MAWPKYRKTSARTAAARANLAKARRAPRRTGIKHPHRGAHVHHSRTRTRR